MGGIVSIIAEFDEFLDSRRKRHLVGGLLISVALLFGGLAITVSTMKE